MDELKELPHRRLNILTGEWILVSPHRTKRPWQGNRNKPIEVPKIKYDDSCYLCPGNSRAGGAINPNYEGTFSFVNDFGAILYDTSDVSFNEGLLQAKSEKGICKVVCFSPDHSLTLPVMRIDEIEQVIKLWMKEYEELEKNPTINHVQIFENKGEIMGCSNPHPHGQIWAQESIPEEVKKKEHHQLIHWKKTSKSLLKVYMDQEKAMKERIVLENDDFIALVPYWAVWPYETMILPKKHQQHIGQMSATEVTNFASILKGLTTKYDNLFEVSFPYSAGIHQAPTDGKSHDEWHWHMSFYPPLLRSAEVKKFMVGYEMFANPQRDITAELAAANLSRLSTKHYLER